MWVDQNQSSSFRVTVRPSNAYHCTFPDDFEIEIKDPFIVSFDTTYSSLIGGQIGTTFITIKHKYSDLSQRISITVGQIVPDGTYYISNRGSGRFIEQTNGQTNSGVVIQESTLIMAQYQIWNIKYEGNGFYSIKSNNCDMYIGLSTPMPISGVSIVLSPQLNDASLWRIVGTTQGTYAFLSKYGHQNRYSICSQSSDADGQDLSQRIYNDDCSYYDEWYITGTDIFDLYSLGSGVVFNENYTICNIVSSRYLSTSNNSVSTSAEKYTWLNSSQYPESSVFQSRLKDASDLFISFDGTNVELNTDSGYLLIKRFNAKPYDGTYVITYYNTSLYEDPVTMFLCEDPVTHEVMFTDSFSPSCLWSFKTAGNKTANFFYFTNFTEGAYPSVRTSLTSQNYTVIPQADKTAADAYSCLPSTDIFIFRGHGGYGAISFGSTSLDTYGGVYSITGYNDNELSKVDMAFYLGCYTGIKPRDYPDILTTSYNIGIHFAIGTYDTVYTHTGNLFIEKIFEFLQQDNNLKTAISLAQASFPPEENFLPSYNMHQQDYPIIFVGDIYQKL